MCSTIEFPDNVVLTGPEVWRHGWDQLFLVRIQATVTSPLERFIYYFFHQIVANGSVRLNGAGVMVWECTPDGRFLCIYALFS